mgnify:CR=1 FL=1
MWLNDQVLVKERVCGDVFKRQLFETGNKSPANFDRRRLFKYGSDRKNYEFSLRST